MIFDSDQVPPVVDRHWSGVGQAHSPVRILVVDDDPITRDIALLMLDRLGYHADTADNGFEALAAARVHSYDVILMDLQLPEVNGMEATRRIRSELPASLQPTVIAMSASTTTQVQTLCVEAGMDEYLTKPLRIRQLAVVLEACGSRSDRAGRPGQRGGPGQPVQFGQRVQSAQPVRSARDVGTWIPPPIALVLPTMPISPVEGSPVYDPALLDDLVATLGPKSGQIRQELIETFLDGADDRVVAIGLAAPSDDGEALAFSAHAMKSASASLGLVALSEAAGRIESAYRDAPETMDVATEAVRLIGHHDRATAVLREVLETDASEGG